MVYLLIIADDFTGALDTGVQFAARGMKTLVVVGTSVDFDAQAAEVLVVDSETRHLPAGEAYDAVFELTKRAKTAGVPFLYKKTDSALRGNIGAELSAVLSASGKKLLPFLPAYPQTGRVTREGIHYIDGIPVTDSPFGRDPFEPVKHSRITELIAEQSGIPVKSFPPLGTKEELSAEEGILIFDAGSEEDLLKTGRALKEAGSLSVSAGCAGFGSVLTKLLGISAEKAPAVPLLDPRLLVVCGSVNPITTAQLDYAEKKGFARIRLTPAQKLESAYWDSEEGKQERDRMEKVLAGNPRCIIDTNDDGGNAPTAAYARELGIDTEELRVRVAGTLGHLVRMLFTSPSLGTLLLTGGDTLLQCMACIGVRELVPICEMEKGVVLASFTCNGCTRHVITKSGGFGQENLLTELSERIAAGNEK